MLWTNHWKKENRRLAYVWRTLNYRNIEANRVEYTRKIQIINLKESIRHRKIQYYPVHKRYLRHLFSLIILILMVNINEL